jgi:hypothetical protein
MLGVACEVGAYTCAARFTACASNGAVTAMALVRIEPVALAIALAEGILALACAVLALGAVTAIVVPLAVPANILAGRCGVLPASGQHCDDAGDDGASWPGCGKRPCKGIKASCVHVNVLLSTQLCWL